MRYNRMHRSDPRSSATAEGIFPCYGSDPGECCCAWCARGGGGAGRGPRRRPRPLPLDRLGALGGRRGAAVLWCSDRCIIFSDSLPGAWAIAGNCEAMHLSSISTAAPRWA